LFLESGKILNPKGSKGCGKRGRRIGSVGKTSLKG
jgi:hypothetical protein